VYQNSTAHFYFQSVFVPLMPVAVPAFHNFAFGNGADHKLEAGAVADNVVLAVGALLAQADGGEAFVWVHNDEGAEFDVAASPAVTACTLFVSTTPGLRDCGTF